MTDSRVTTASIYKAILLAFGLVVAALIFQALVDVVLAVLIVVILAIPISAVASALQKRGIPRAVGAPITLLCGLAALGGLIALIIPAFTHEINQFASSLPSIVDSLRHRLGAVTGTSPSHAGRQIQQFVNGYTEHPSKLLGPLTSIGASVAGVLAALVVVLLTALYTAIHPKPLVEGFTRLFPPNRREHVREVLSRLRTAYLGWLRGLILGMLVLGSLTYLGLELVGLGFAAFFAVFTAIAMIIPYFGALASSIPPVIYALTISPGKAVLVAIIYIAAHQLESNLIQPLVVARTVKLHPAVVAVGVVAVDRLFGFIGLIVAVPILATVTILFDELWVKPLEARHGGDDQSALTANGSPRRSPVAAPAGHEPRP